MKNKTTLTQQEIDFLESFLSCCFETGGSTYWISKVESDAETYHSCTFTDDPDGRIRIYDGEQEEWHEFGAKEMLEGINKVIKYKSIEDDDAGRYDNGDADCAIQHAIFGKVIYG